MRMIRFVAVSITALALAAVPAVADGNIGVILMHGKNGAAGSGSPVGKLAAELEGAGFRVAAPDMAWSRSRRFDGTVEETAAEIDQVVRDLKSQGASKIVVGGHSLGAAAALSYGARREGLAGVLAIAPGHAVDVDGFQNKVDYDYKTALSMIESGRGDEKAGFKDVNQGKQTVKTMTAKVYFSWFAPDGPAAMSKNAANLKPGTPLMWIYGEKDRLMVLRGRDYAFSRAPDHPNNAYVVAKGGHKATPRIGASKIIDWLQGL